MEEIASMLGCSVDLLERRYADLIKEKQDQGKSSLRRSMYLKAKKGDTGMMIWLSKNLLGMSDKTEVTNKGSIQITHNAIVGLIKEREAEKREIEVKATIEPKKKP